jgi:hypothetical protein
MRNSKMDRTWDQNLIHNSEKTLENWYPRSDDGYHNYPFPEKQSNQNPYGTEC